MRPTFPALTLLAMSLVGAARAELGGSRFSVQMDQARANAALSTATYVALSLIHI